jgi:hypothetical protein
MNKLLLKKPENMTPIQLEKIYKICWDEIHKREELKKEKALKEFVGKCYKYKNCYSCPDSEEDYWWLFIYVKDVKDGCLVCQTFQKDKYGKIMIDLNDRICSINNNYLLCGKATFNLELEKIMVEIGDAQY